MKSFLIFACLATCVFAVDYCKISSCDPKPHIGCGNNGALSPTCPKGSQKVPFSKPLIDIAVDDHNKNRNDIAGGKVHGFKSAARMATIRWNAELAKVACFNVYRCEYGHDACRNTETYPYSGQNLYMYSTTQTIKSGDVPTLVKNGIQEWYNEHQNATMADINKLPRNIKDIGHFTLMVAEKNVELGCCGVISPPDSVNPDWNNFILACNYATTNIYDRPVYKQSNKPASDCKSKNNDYPNLCAVGETYPSF